MLEKGKECRRKGETVGEKERMSEKERMWEKGKNVG